MVTNYINGNYLVTLYSDGTKKFRAFRVGESLEADFPDSIDIKITNKCSHQCIWCHESSVPNGISFDLEKTKNVLADLPKVGIELAIGGGNVMELDRQVFSEFLYWCVQRNFKTRITITWKDLVDNLDYIDELTSPKDSNSPLVGAIGISMSSIPKNMDDVWSRIWLIPRVFHVIAGVFDVNKLPELLRQGSVLILGYKEWGRGKTIDIPDLTEWKEKIKQVIYHSRGNPFDYTLSFDNLGIEQLNIQDCLLNKEWESCFMGPEFSHSMYVDAVNEVYAPTSRDPERVSWDEAGNIVGWFKNNRVKHD